MLLFARYDVLSACICDNAKEMIQGKCHQKLEDAGCQFKYLEPFISWLNAAEREIKELKKEVGPKLLQSRAPKLSWYDCLELEAYIMSNTAHVI